MFIICAWAVAVHNIYMNISSPQLLCLNECPHMS